MTKIFNFFGRRRDRLEKDLDRELRYHLDRRIADLVQSGLSDPEARRQANLEFGGIPQIQEEVRETWVWRWLDTLMLDVRYAVRGLIKSWGFTLGAGLVLALGIGAAIAIFSVVNATLLQPLPYPDADRIVSVETFWTNTGRTSPDASGPDFLDWQAQNDVFETMAHFSGEGNLAILVGDRPEFANEMFVSPGFFAVFGLPPAAGRLLAAEDVPAANPTVVVVRHGWAETHFGSAEAAIGQTIVMYGMPLQIVGVAARGFSYPSATDLWAPWPTSQANRSAPDFHVVGKLKAEVDLAHAQAQMRTIGDSLGRQYPENRYKTVTLTPLQERLTGDVQMMLWMLLASVLVVLLIACANVSSLLLARATVRTHEIALRAALGAGRARLVRQLLTEGCVLGALAAGAGLVVASMLMRALVVLAPADLPRLNEMHVDVTVLLFALGLSLVATLLFGLVPAIHTSRLDLSDALKLGGSKGTAPVGRSRSRAALVVGEVALSVILLATAGLLFRSFQVLQRVELGFTTENVLVAYTQYVSNTAEDRRNRTRFYADFLERLRNVPGVRAAAGMAFLPMGRELRPVRDYFVQGQPERQPGERPKAEYQAVTPGFFHTLDIPIRAGRDFDRTDTLERPPVAIVNEALARASFRGESPLGQRIRRGPNAPWMEIVGVVADTRWNDPSLPPPAVIYASATQGAGGSLSILARTSLDEAALAVTFRTILHEMDPTVPMRFETMEDLFAGALAYPRFRAQLIGAFAGGAALLAAVGLFSMLAYMVGQRTREIAIRRAVGAQAGDVIRLVFSQGLRLVGIGLVLGLAGALVVARFIEGLLYEISPWDVGTYASAIGVLGAAALLATLIPAIKAVTITPLIVLQQE